MRKYLATAKMCFVEKNYFGFAEYAGQYLLRAATLGALLMIWRSLFTQGADTQGMTLNQIYVYTILSFILGPLLNVRTPASNWLHNGTMLGLYQRPASIFGQLIAHTIGGWAMPLLLLVVPTVLIAPACGVNLRPVSLWCIPSVIMAVSAGFAVDFLFACLMIRLRNLEYPVHSLRNSLTALFTGALIPFSLLPWGIGKYLALTPLGALAGAPLAIYAGLDAPARLLIAQLIWNAVLWPLACLCFRRSSERMVSFGG